MTEDTNTELDDLAAAARDAVTGRTDDRLTRRLAHQAAAERFADQLADADGPTTTTVLTRSILSED